MPMATRHKAWKTALDTLDLDINASDNADTIFNISKIKIAMDMAIADAGATRHVVLPDTPVTNLHIAIKPLVINLPDGDQIKSTHTCEIMVPWLQKMPKELTLSLALHKHH